MNLTSALLSALGASLLYAALTVYQRLVRSPLAHIPGPRLAAATFWYEFYHDIVRGGQYIWQLRALHAQYGPVVRISPDEVHVADPAFWEVLYAAGASGNRRDKPARHAKGTGIPASMLGTAPHALHRLRRGALSPFFSRANVRKLLPRIQERVDALVDRLRTCGRNGEIVHLEHAFSAYTNDVVMQYSFGRNDHHIEAPAFDPKFHKISFETAKAIPLLKHCNWLVDLVHSLPESIAIKLGDGVSGSVVLKNDFIKQVEDIRRAGPQNAKPGERTILHEILQTDLPAPEKANGRLAEESALLVGAGTHTSSWVLTVLTFHLLAQPPLLRRLKDELRAAGGPCPQPVATLEKLPFLTAVLKEGLRLAYGTSGRSARCAPDVALTCAGVVIPAGTAVSMTTPLTHHDPRVFADPDSFVPDRWMDPLAAVALDRYMTAFSRGSRSCLGINLAWVELYVCAAAVFGHFGSSEVTDEGDVGVMELFETDVTDVRMESDMFFPIPKKGSKGVRVAMSAN